MEDLLVIKDTIEGSTLYTTIVGGVIVILIIAILSFFLKSFRILLARFYYAIISYLSWKKSPYEVIDLRKHTTICHNGHIIILHDFTLKINKNTSDKFSRMFDVSDASNKCRLPVLKDMLKTKKEKRFFDYGFWFHSNPENIFDEVKELDASANNYKHRNFYFRFNKKNLKSLLNNKIKLMYGYSIKYGQPITNGYFDKSQVSGTREPVVMSQFKVMYKMNTLEYIFSFEDTVKIKKEDIKIYYFPNGIDCEYTKKELKFAQKDDLYYNKYVVKLSKPKLNSMIQIRVPMESNDSN